VPDVPKWMEKEEMKGPAVSAGWDGGICSDDGTCCDDIMQGHRDAEY
jgi:hypothetical protein